MRYVFYAPCILLHNHNVAIKIYAKKNLCSNYILLLQKAYKYALKFIFCGTGSIYLYVSSKVIKTMQGHTEITENSSNTERDNGVFL